MRWRESAEGVLDFDRDGSVRCVANLSDAPVDLPGHAGLMLASGPVEHDVLPPDTAVWLRVTPAAGDRGPI